MTGRIVANLTIGQCSSASALLPYLVVRHRYATCILAVCLSIVVLHRQALAQESSAQFERPEHLFAIAFDPARQPLDPDEISAILPVRRNEPYHTADIRDSIGRLYATGRYQDIQVDATLADGGVALRFITKNSWFTGHVGVESDISEPPGPGQIVNAARLDLGTPFDEDQLSVSEENIRKLLTDNGYFNPQVSHRLNFDEAYQQVRITFVISARKRAHYDVPEIQGDASILSAKGVDKATRWHRFLLPGYRGVTQNRTRSGYR